MLLPESASNLDMARTRTRFIGLLLVPLVLFAASSAQAQDRVVNDGTQESVPSPDCSVSPDDNTIQDAVDNASAGQTILVCPGTYGEQVNVTKSLTINGPYNGTPGYDGTRGANEAVVNGGTSSPVDQTANIAFTVQDDDVTIDGFTLSGNQGVVLDPTTVSNFPTNDGAGLTVTNNLITTNIVGVRIQNVTTTGSKSFTITDNQFELQRQSYDLIDSQEGGSPDNTEGDENSEYTASVAIQTIEGDKAPLIKNNVVTDDGNDISGDGDPDGSFYGYAIDGLKVTSGRTTIAGDPGNTGTTGTIQGTAQGIGILDGQTSRQSNVAIEDFLISAMSGSAPNNEDANFQAGVFTYTETAENTNTTDVEIANTTIEGLDYSDPDDAGGGAAPSANIYLASFDFGFGATPTHNVTIEGVTVQSTEHRGIFVRGDDVSGSFLENGATNFNVTVTKDGAGDNTVLKGVTEGADAHPIHSERGGSLTINNAEIINKDISAADAVHIRDAGATITFGDDVTVNSNNRTTFGDLGGRAADADLKVTSPTSLSAAKVDLVNGDGIIELTGSSTLSVTDRLTLTSGTFDVSSGNLTLASDGPASAAFISGSGTGTLTGNVTVEWKVPSGPDGWDGWQTLTAPVDAPFDGGTSDALLSNMWTQKSGSGTGYDAANGSISNSSVFSYDETASVGGTTTEDLNDAWVVPSDISTALTQGQTGRLVFFFGDRDFDGTDDSGSPFTLSATGSVLAKENTDTDVDLGLTYTENDGGGDGDGWNLVGNPFMAPIDWEDMTNDGAGRTNVERTVYIPTANNNYATYQANNSGPLGTATNGGTRYISPFQGFFVKATGSDPELTLKSSDKALGQSPTLKQSKKTAPQTVKLRMEAESSSRDEETVVRFSDEAALDDSDGDAYQLVPPANEYFYIASEIAGKNSAYEIQSLPPPGSDGRTVPLTVRSARPGTYTVGGTLNNAPSGWDVQLKNRDTGETADLQADETLTLSLNGSKKSASSRSSASPRRSPSRNGQPLVAPASGHSSESTTKATSGASPRLVLKVTDSAPLPVELAQFDGQTTENAIELRWTTASETNNTGFQVQRSASGTEQWTDLGFVEGHGTTSSPQRYRFTDERLPYDGQTFEYRLKQVDSDGSVALSDPIEVERGTPSTVRLQSVFPNPARKQATVRYTLPEATHVTMALYDVLGRKVATVIDEQQEAGRQQHPLSVSSFATGVHVLRMQANQTVKTKKLVVIE